MFRPAKQITWADITSRTAEADRSYRQFGAAASSMAGGVIGYSIYKKAAGMGADTRLESYPRRYTYYQGDKKLIVILAREMENADQFDRLVRDHLDGKPIEAGAASALPDWENGGKKKGRTILAGVIGVICVLAVAAIAVIPRIRSMQTVQGETGAAFLPYTCEDVTFQIDPAWSAIEGHDGSFIDDKTGIIYQLNGVSRLYPYDAEAFYTELLAYYEESHDPVIGGQLERSTTADGEERYLANMRMVQDGTYYQYLTVVIFPWQDTVVTFGAQTVADQAALFEDEIIQTVENMALSATYTGQTQQVLTFDLDETYFAGTAWTAENDGSLWMFEEDKTFHWYQDRLVTDDNYYAGTYEFYVGEDAKDYLTGYLADYGITEEELMSTMNAAQGYALENFVCLTATNQSFMRNGQEQLSEPTETHYCGFLLEDGARLSIVNMSTASQYEFTKD